VALGQVFGLVASLTTGIVTARELAPAGRGELGLALLIPALLGLFLGFGSAIANVYLLGSGSVDPRSLSQISVALCTLGSVVGAVIVALLWQVGLLPRWLPRVHGSFVALAMVMLPITLLFSSYRAMLRGLQRIRMTAVVDLAQAASIAAATCIALLVLHTGVQGAIVANLIGGSITLVLIGSRLRGLGLSVRPRLPKRHTRRVVTFGARGDLANLTQFFTYRFDSFLINSLRTSAAVGVYAVGARLAELVWVAPAAVASVIVPKAAAASTDALNEQTPRVFGKVLALNVLFGALLCLVGAVGIRVLYSHAYAGAYKPMVLMMPGVVLLGGASILTGDTTGRGHPGYNSINSLLGFGVTLGLDLILIPRSGISGAAIASSIAYAVNFVLAVAFFLRVSGVGFREFWRQAVPWRRYRAVAAET
jgi:O-antigen/teichoic acid export membrane protein